MGGSSEIINKTYNGTILNYEFSAANTAWVLTASALVFIMIPGVGYFYGGLTRRKSQLTMLLTSGLALGIVLFEWFLWGYSLAFSQTGSKFVGDLDHIVLIDVDVKPHPLAPTIPCNLYMLYQGMFATLAPVLAFGSAAERTTMSTYAIFVFIWSTIVYNFVAYWHWAKNGWLHAFGVLDFAGGTPVHLTSGFSAFAYALCVGPRRTVNLKKINPSNISDVFLGTCLIWFGFFGFAGGSEFAINARAVMAVINCNLAAGVGGLTWMFAEMIKHKKKKMSLNGFCSGAISGLCVITPSAGYIRPHFAVVCGFIAGIVCLIAVDIKRVSRFKYDDACDVFAVHGTGGFVRENFILSNCRISFALSKNVNIKIGCLLTGFFADQSIVSMAGDTSIKGGWVNGNYMQVLYQLLAAVVASVWSFTWTFIILQILGSFPCLRLKLTEQEELLGSDWIAMGELADSTEAEAHDNHMLKEFERQISTMRESNIDILKSYFKKSDDKVADSSQNKKNNKTINKNNNNSSKASNNDKSPRNVSSHQALQTVSEIDEDSARRNSASAPVFYVA